MIQQFKSIVLTVCILICLAAWMALVITLPLIAIGAATIGLVVICYQQARYYIGKDG